MSNDLITFEERINNWQTIHPRQWISTTNRGDVANFISAQTEEIIESQVEAANAIIVSQDRIADKIDIATREITGGFQELQATFDWGFTELIWQIEQEREVLKDILKVLQAPLDTQAKELKKRAEYAYQNGWIDDALKDFLESEKKNRYDFTIHQNLGNIYLFKKKDQDKALEYYKKAVKYATPKSSYYTSISLLHIGVVKYLQKDFKEAYNATLKAIELSPDFYEAHYQHAQYCASLGKYNEAIKNLKKAIVEGDKYYCVKAESEKDFDVMKEQLKSLFKELQINAQNQVTFELGEAARLIDIAKSSYNIPLIDNLKVAQSKLQEAAIFIEKGSLFDCHDAARKIFVGLKTVLDFSVEFLSNEFIKLYDEICTLKEELERKKSSFFSFFGAQKKYSLQIAPLETRNSELKNKFLKTIDKQTDFYVYMEEEIKNEKDPEKLETLLQKNYMSILGLIEITKTGKESKKDNFTLDFKKYFRQKRRERKKSQKKKPDKLQEICMEAMNILCEGEDIEEESCASKKKSIKEMTDEELYVWILKKEGIL